jgi:hypothetical protein
VEVISFTPRRCGRTVGASGKIQAKRNRTEIVELG